LPKNTIKNGVYFLEYEKFKKLEKGNWNNVKQKAQRQKKIMAKQILSLNVTNNFQHYEACSFIILSLAFLLT
jgi:transcription-repair coupling factor (superfamily II helicase)